MASGGVELDATVTAERACDGLVGSSELGADGIGTGAAAGAAASGLAANGTQSLPAAQEAEGVWGVADTRVDCSDDAGCGGAGGSGEDGGLDNNEGGVTNEPETGEDAAGVQEVLNQEVTADSKSALGLDNDGSAVTNEPNSNEDAAGVQNIENQEVMADSELDLGLDNGEIEANFERISASGRGAEGGGTSWEGRPMKGGERRVRRIPRRS